MSKDIRAYLSQFYAGLAFASISAAIAVAVSFMQAGIIDQPAGSVLVASWCALGLVFTGIGAAVALKRFR